MKPMLLLAGLLLCASCSKKESSDALILADMTDVINHVEVLPLETWAKSVKYIPLETNDSILIKYIGAASLQDGKLLLSIQNRCVAFDLDGKFLNNVARRGEGPEEFASQEELIAGPKEINVLVAGNKIKTYDWQGKFLRSTPIPDANIKDVHPVNGTDVMAGYVQNLSGSEPNRLIFFRDTTIVGTNPYPKTFQKGEIMMVFYDECRFFNLPDKTTAFKEMFNDTVYTIDKQLRVKPYMALDFGKYKTAEDARYTLKDPRKSIFDDTFNTQVVGEVNETLYLVTYYKNEDYCFSYNKKTGQGKAMQLTLPDNEELGLSAKQYFNCAAVSDDNKYLIGWMQPENDNNPVMILVEP